MHPLPHPDPQPNGPAVDLQRKLDRLLAFADTMLREVDLDPLLWSTASIVGKLMGFEDCVVYLVEPEGLVQYAAHGPKSPNPMQLKNRIALPHGRGIVGAVAQSGESELIDDTGNDPRYVADDFAGRSEVAVPIKFAGRVIGVIDCEARARSAFTPADRDMLQGLAKLAAPRIATALAEREHARAVQRQQHQRIDSLGQLAGGIAHDFNNLLTAILGNLAMARDEQPSAVCDELLVAAMQACDRARGLTKQLLTYARGGAPIRVPGDIGALLRDTVERELQGRLPVEFAIDPSLPLVEYDRLQMTQVFQNLTRSAVHLGEVIGQVQVSATCVDSADGEMIEIRIADDGPPVTAEQRERLFEPYFRCERAPHGLALSTAFWVLRRHGGTLEVDAQLTDGNCFVIRLPVGSMIGPREAPVARSGAPLRVLVLDDDVHVRTMLVRMLRHLEHEVDDVEDGEQCVRRYGEAVARGEPYDAVLMDLTLKGSLDGLQTLHAIAAAHPEVRAVVSSGYHDSPVLADYRRAGFAARLEKPFTRNSLQDALDEAMGSRR